MPRVLACLLLAILPACAAAVDWQPAGSRETWRGRSLWSTAEVAIGASAEDAAVDVLGLYRDMLRAYAEIGEPPPPAPLLIAVDADDATLLGDVERTAGALARWHTQVLWGEQPPQGMRASTLAPDASPEAQAAVVGSIAAAVPLAAAELALPITWQRAGQWGMILPTAARIAATSEQMLDEAMAKSDLNFAQRILAAPFLPWVRGMMRDTLRELEVRFLVDASCAPAVLGRPFPEARKVALLAALGLPPKLRAPEPPPFDAPVAVPGASGAAAKR